MQLNWPEGIDEAIFLRDYWQQKPLYIPNAFTGFESPLDQNDLAGLSMDEDIPSRVVWEEKDGRQWTLERGPFDEEKLASMPTSGWSLLVSDVEKHLPAFVEYFAALNFLPSWRIDDLMISTAPDGGSVGPHIDEYDVFLFQAEGQRHWSLAPTPDNGFGMIEDADLKIIDQWQADESMLCSPGDLLYLPPGYGHHGVAKGDGCVTWSFGFRAPNAAELINGFVDDHSASSFMSQRFADPSRAISANVGEISAIDFEKLSDMIRGALSDDNRLRAWLGCYLSEPALPPQEPDHTALPATGDIQRRTDVKMLFGEVSDQCHLFVGGEAFECSVDLARTLTASWNYDASQLNFDGQDRWVIEQLWERTILFQD